VLIDQATSIDQQLGRRHLAQLLAVTRQRAVGVVLGGVRNKVQHLVRLHGLQLGLLNLGLQVDRVELLGQRLLRLDLGSELNNIYIFFLRNGIPSLKKGTSADASAKSKTKATMAMARIDPVLLIRF
jgi:hypothetical protein